MPLFFSSLLITGIQKLYKPDKSILITPTWDKYTVIENNRLFLHTNLSPQDIADTTTTALIFQKKDKVG